MAIRFISQQRVTDRAAVWQEFDRLQATWLVSDLRSKQEIFQELLASKNGSSVIEQDRVLRISEFWRKLLFQARPDFRVISLELALSILNQYLQSEEAAFEAATSSTASQLFHYMTELLPIINHPQGWESLQEWMSENPAAQVRWGRWAAMGFSAWSVFVEKKYVAKEWVAPLLSEEWNAGIKWSRPLLVDLGFELGYVEAELLKQIGRTWDINIVVPDLDADAMADAAMMRAYELLGWQSKRKPQDKVPRSFQLMRVSTPLAEVKFATAKIRSWLEAGVDPKKIALVLPDIEDYRRCLKVYFDKEGIPYDLPNVQRLTDHLEVQKWLASLRREMGEASSSLAETELFAGETKPNIDHATFQKLLSKVYGAEDLERYKGWSGKESLQNDFSRNQFLQFLVGHSQTPSGSRVRLEFIEKLISRILSDASSEVNMSLRLWLDYLNTALAKIQLTTGEVSGGVRVLNLSSYSSVEFSHLIALGLTDGNMVIERTTQILRRDRMSLAARYGFPLDWETEDRRKYQLNWLFTADVEEWLGLCPVANFTGEVESLSPFFSKHPWQEVKIESHPRLDQIQRANASGLFSEEFKNREHLLARLDEDHGVKAPSPIRWNKPLRLSASSLESYWECPFILLSRKLFGLSDEAALDLDFDASTRGRLLHAIFFELTDESVLQRYRQGNFGQADISHSIDQAMQRAKIEPGDKKLFTEQRPSFLSLAERFLKAETQWRSQYPSTRTVGREALVKGYVNSETGALSETGGANDFMFSGSIDRIDLNSKGQAVVIDYKMTGGQLKQYNKWLESGQWQLALYCQALESGMVEVKPQEVLSAVYLIARDWNRDYGFKITDVDTDLYSVDDRKKNKCTQDEYRQLLEGLQVEIKKIIDRIGAGEWNAAPRSPEDCPSCRWRRLCRSPHLSL